MIDISYVKGRYHRLDSHGEPGIARNSSIAATTGASDPAARVTKSWSAGTAESRLTWITGNFKSLSQAANFCVTVVPLVLM